MGVLGKSRVQSPGRGSSGRNKGRQAPPAPWQVCGAEEHVSGVPEVWQGIHPSILHFGQKHEGRLAQLLPLCTEWHSDSSTGEETSLPKPCIMQESCSSLT